MELICMSFEAFEDRSINYARKLIKTPSLSGEEKDLALLVKDLLIEIGVDDVFIDEIGNVVALIKGKSDVAVMFEGHLDHVPPGNLALWKVDPYSA